MEDILQIVKKIDEFTYVYGLSGTIMLFLTSLFVYYAIKKPAKLFGLITSLAIKFNILNEDKDLPTKEDLLSHKFFISRTVLLDKMSRWKFKNKFRTEISKEYFRLIIETEIKETTNFINTVDWKNMNNSQLELATNKFIYNMLRSERKECLAAGIPRLFFDKMCSELKNEIDQIYNDLKSIFSNPMFKEKRYNSLKISLMLDAAEAKWELIEKRIEQIANNINGEFKKHNIVFKGYKDED